jgi:8-oxo-dGTP diphosphatase
MTGAAESSFAEPATVVAVKSGDLGGITLDRPRVIVDVNLLLRDGPSILLGRRVSSKFGNGCYSLPAGHLELGESVEAALIREAREELGITIAAEDVTFIQVMHNSYGLGRIAFFFEVCSWDGEVINCEPEKCEDLRWFPLDALPTTMIPYIRQAIDSYRAGERAKLALYGW